MRTDGRTYEANSHSHNFANAPQNPSKFYGQTKSRFMCEDPQSIIFALSGTCIIPCFSRRVHGVVLQDTSMGTNGMSRRRGTDLIHAKILTTPIHPTSLWRSIICLVSFSLLQGFWKWRIWFLFSLTSSPFSFSIPPPLFYLPFRCFIPWSLISWAHPLWHGISPPTRTRTHPAKIPPAPIPPPNLTNLLSPPPTVLLLTIPPWRTHLELNWSITL